jgi:pilus assembly protein Flp/PilA
MCARALMWCAIGMTLGTEGVTPRRERKCVLRNMIFGFLANEQGATAIEYGLIAAGIAVAIIATVFGLGTSLNSTFSTVSSSLQ